VKVFFSDRAEREATSKMIETSKAAGELSKIIRQLEATVSSDRTILESQYRELQVTNASHAAIT
jgi:hypothetical protein